MHNLGLIACPKAEAAAMVPLVLKPNCNLRRFRSRHQRRPLGRWIGRSCCLSPAYLNKCEIVLPGEFMSGPTSERLGGAAGAALFAYFLSLQTESM
jgi:hypothetical protein